MSQRIQQTVLFFLIIMLSTGLKAMVTVYTDEQQYIDALNAAGYAIITEGFENDLVWGDTRSTSVTGGADSVTSQGLVWTANNATSQVRTSEGSAFAGTWGMFSNPHGDYDVRGSVVCAVPNVCTDGVIATSADTLLGIGGWFTGNPGGELNIILDGAVADFGGGLVTRMDATYKFFAVIDTAGFKQVEFREVEGTFEDRKTLFIDQIRFVTGTATGNTAPVADAGLDQSVTAGSVITLDGSGSSDVDGDTLTHNWTLTAVPAGSTAILSDSTAVMPTFTADLAGSYVAQLVVNDGTDNSLPDTVTISTTATNVIPVADAGLDQSVTTGSIVTLDGSGSSDADGDNLTYHWILITVPAGSTASLSDSTAAMPTFSADLAGNYVAQLIVNDGTDNSLSDSVSISSASANVIPIANAGPDQSVSTGSTVMLDGSGSSDANNDPLSYSWSLTTVPLGSTAVLTGNTEIMPTFSADLAGNYIAQLIVNDGTDNSLPDTVTISTSATNVKPVADAGLDQSIITGDTVTLDGSGSSDSNGDSLTFSWSLISVPLNSSTLLSDATAVMPTLTADLAGTYIAQLVVNDGLSSSDPDMVNIIVSDVATVSNSGGSFHSGYFFAAILFVFYLRRKNALSVQEAF